MNSLKSLKIFTMGGRQTGFGHLSRMIPMYDAWCDAEHEACFFIEGDYAALGILEGRKAIICNWQANDSFYTIMDSDCLLIDTLSAPREFISKVLKITRKVFFISDEISTPEYPFPVINWRVGAESLQAKNGLYGEKYVPLRKEVLRASQMIGERQTQVSDVVIAMGAGDILNLIPRTLEIIDEVISQPLHIKIVIRRFHPHYEEIHNKYGGRIELLTDLQADDLFWVIAGSNLAIASGGHSIYEFACLGIPVIHVRVASNQEPAKCWDNSGFTFPIGLYDPETYAHKIKEGLAYFSEAKRTRASERGRELIDGLGAGRIRDYLFTEAI